MKLQLNEPFTLEITSKDKEDEVLTGTLAPVTKAQKKEFEAYFLDHKKQASKLQKQSKDLSRLSLKIEKAELDGSDTLDELYKQADKLEDSINKGLESLKDLDSEEAAARKRIDTCVSSDDLERIHEIADIVGYKAILDTILKDIEEKKGNATPSS